MNEAEIKRLQAEVAQAEAEAAAAKVAATKAKLEAALAAGQSTRKTGYGDAVESDESASTNETTKATISAPEDPEEPEPVELSEYAAKVTDGYQDDDTTFTVGTYLENGEPVPGVHVTLPLAMMNRHGLVAGATGTGKTRTLQLLAEGLSTAGVPVFVTDIKGDLTGLLEPGRPSDALLARTTAQGQDWIPAAFPTELYALGGQGNGAPIRTTVTDFGPLLLAKVLGLNETQESALSLIFHWADTNKLGLIDLGDLRDVISYLISPKGKAEMTSIGGVAPATAGVILREISALQAQGADKFFGEPAFQVSELLRTATDGRGVISALELPDVQSRPALFSTFIIWLLAELFQELPEVGDTDMPTLVFFFDEAHLLFTDASKEFLNQVIQTVRLIRSKGVGIFFVTQTPQDIPADVLAQLGSKIQHALRAHTPKDAAALRETVTTFPITAELNLNELLPSLGTGEAIVTVLDEKGRPSPVAPTKIWAPASVMGVASQEVIDKSLANSTAMPKYKDRVDPESATELLKARIAAEEVARTEAEAQKKAAEEAAKAEEAAAQERERQARELEKQIEAERKAAIKAAERRAREAEKEAQRQAKRRDSMIDSVLKTAGRAITSEITRSIFGTRKK